MSTDTAKNNRFVRISGLLAIIAGAVMVIAGAVTWGAVSSHLTAENITVSEDAAAFGGQTVNTPWEAYAQAEIINHHALEATGGKTYAELDKEDPLRAVAMNGSFLRASLFTSVVAFGVAALVMGVGVVFGLIGFALRTVAPAAEVVAPAGRREPRSPASDSTPAEPGLPRGPGSAAFAIVALRQPRRRRSVMTGGAPEDPYKPAPWTVGRIDNLGRARAHGRGSGTRRALR